MVLLHKDPNAAIVTQPTLYLDGTWHIQWKNNEWETLELVELTHSTCV